MIHNTRVILTPLYNSGSCEHTVWLPGQSLSMIFLTEREFQGLLERLECIIFGSVVMYTILFVMICWIFCGGNGMALLNQMKRYNRLHIFVSSFQHYQIHSWLSSESSDLWGKHENNSPWIAFLFFLEIPFPYSSFFLLLFVIPVAVVVVLRLIIFHILFDLFRKTTSFSIQLWIFFTKLFHNLTAPFARATFYSQ